MFFRAFKRSLAIGGSIWLFFSAGSVYSKSLFKCSYLQKINYINELKIHKKYIKKVVKKNNTCPSINDLRIVVATKLISEFKLLQAKKVIKRIKYPLDLKRFLLAQVFFYSGKLKRAYGLFRKINRSSSLYWITGTWLLKTGCRIKKCHGSIKYAVDRLPFMPDEMQFKTRLMLIEAYKIISKDKKAYNLALYLYFNSNPYKAKHVMRLIKSLWPQKADYIETLRDLLLSRSIKRFVQKNYNRVRRYNSLKYIANISNNYDSKKRDPLIDAAVAFREMKSGNYGPAASFIEKKLWSPLVPLLLDRLLEQSCDSLSPDTMLNYIKVIPPETNFRIYARLKIGACLLKQNRPLIALKILKIRVKTHSNNIVYGTTEQLIQLLALANFMAGKKGRAIRLWRLLINSYPYTIPSLFAASHLKAMKIKLHPLKRGEYSNLGHISRLLLKGKLIDQALLLLQSARYSGHLTTLDTQLLGHILYKYKNWRSQLMSVLRGIPDKHYSYLFKTAYPRAYTQYIENAALKVGLDIPFLFAMVRAESRFKPWAVSKTGAIGLMQIQKNTARIIANRLLHNPDMLNAMFYPAYNLLLGGSFLKLLVRHFGGCAILEIIAYNSGISTASSWQKRMKSVPTEIALFFLRPLVLKNYVENIMIMRAAYSLIYGYKSDYLPKYLSIPQKTYPFPISLSY